MGCPGPYAPSFLNWRPCFLLQCCVLTDPHQSRRSIQAQQPQLLHQLQNEGRGSFNLSQKRVKAWALKLRPRVIRTEGGLVTDRESCFGGWEGGPGAGGTWPGSGRRGLRLSVGPLQAAGKQQSLEEKGART